MKEITNEFFTFFASLRTTISKEFYSEISDRLLKERIPIESLTVETRLGYVGKRSESLVYNLLQSQNEQSSCADSKVLASNTCQMVFVNKTSHLPATLPDWWLQKYSKLSDPDKKLKLQIMDVPFSSLIFIHHFPVSWNHTDFYHHTHFNSYVGFCFEVANQAIHNGFFPDGFKCSGDILNRKVKLIEMLYLNESVAGDKLRAGMWVDQYDSQSLRFSFERGDPRWKTTAIVCQGTLGFYD